MLDYTAQPTTEKMLDFLSSLRDEGYNTGLSESRDAIRLACGEMMFQKTKLRTALKHLLSSNHEEWLRFDHFFELYFRDCPDEGDGGGNQDRNKQTHKRGDANFVIIADFYQGESEVNEGSAGRDNAVARTDFRFLTEKEGWEEAARATEDLAKKVRVKLTRRWRKRHRGKRIDLRTTARRLPATDGDPLRIGYKTRKKRPLHVVTLLDVSHSMSYYSPMLARFTRGLVHNFEGSEAFSFHVELNRITDLLRETDMEVMRQKMEDFQNLWYGGTNISASLQKFYSDYISEYTDHNSVVLLMSDGCDTSGVDEIIGPLGDIRRRVRRVFWVNPVQARLERANMVSSSPLSLASQFIDGQISGDSIKSLEQLARVLSR